MLRRTVAKCVQQPWQMMRPKHFSNINVLTVAVKDRIIRSLKDHYDELCVMVQPPKVDPPRQFRIMKGAIDNDGPVLIRNFNEKEQITISVMRLANIIDESDSDDDADDLNQLFIHVVVVKKEMANSLHFLCGLYPDALGIQSVALRPRSTEEGIAIVSNKYTGPVFENLDEETRDAFHNYIAERGINESLFPFLQAWLYVKDHRRLGWWYKSVAVAVSGPDKPKEYKSASGDSETKTAEGAQ